MIYQHSRIVYLLTPFLLAKVGKPVLQKLQQVLRRMIIPGYGGDSLSAHDDLERMPFVFRIKKGRARVFGAIAFVLCLQTPFFLQPVRAEQAIKTATDLGCTPFEQAERGQAHTDTTDSGILRLQLRIHLANSELGSNGALLASKEINRIWWDQARICFQVEFTEDEQPGNGLDLWFFEKLPTWNGYYLSRHEMYVRDAPNLSACKDPAKNAAGRTAAHEIGHALGLSHRQDSADNLMRSKTYGWRLNDEEIAIARETARSLIDGKKQY